MEQIYTSFRNSSIEGKKDIFIWKHREGSKNNYSHYVYSKGGIDCNAEIEYRINNSSHGYDNQRDATPQEKHWLEECIKQNKIIPYQEAMKTFNGQPIYEIY